MTAARHNAHLALIALLYGIALEATLAQSGTIWTWLFASPLAIGGGYFCSLGAELPDEPLQLPAIDALDLRPRWERHPHLDMLRRGERAWVNGIEVAAFGLYALPRLPGYRSYRTQLDIFDSYMGRDEPRLACLRLPLIRELDLRVLIPPRRRVNGGWFDEAGFDWNPWPDRWTYRPGS